VPVVNVGVAPAASLNAPVVGPETCDHAYVTVPVAPATVAPSETALPNPAGTGSAGNVIVIGL
jgi:hypothetical protein